MNLYSHAGSLWKPGILKKQLALLIWQLLCASGLIAQTVTQEKTVTLTYKEVSASVLFKALNQQTGYDFNFSPAEVDQAKIGPLQYKNTPLDKVLKDLGQYGLSFHRAGNIISVSYQKPAPHPNVQAGSGPGTLKGRIVEFETSQPLPDASVKVVGTAIATQSNEQGYYHLSGIPSGAHTLEVSFVGYRTETVQVQVRGERESSYDVRLQGDNVLNEVVIEGIGKTRAPVAHTSERQVIAEIKAAQSVVSGISSQEISRSADRNAAEVVRRISGVTVRDDKFIVIRGMNERYNLTYLNGNIAPSTELYGRAFSLDLIPTRIIDKIMVYKSPAPDLLADMTGGAVKIYTKDAKNVKHFDLELQTGYRQNSTFNNNFLTYQGGKYDFLGFDDGTRALPSSIPGYGDFNKANISQKTYAETFSPILNYGKKTALPPFQLTANYYNTFRVAGKYLSVLSSLSYKNEPKYQEVNREQRNSSKDGGGGLEMGTERQNTDAIQTSLLQNFTYTLNEKNKLHFKNFLLQQGQQFTLLSNSVNSYSSESYDRYRRKIVLQWTQRFLYSGNLAAEHKLGNTDKHQVNWNLGYTYSRLDNPDQRAINLQNGFSPNDPRLPRAGDFEQNWIPVFRGEDWEDPGNSLELGMISRTWIRNTEGVYNGSVDYTYKLKPWMTLKAGTYQQWKERIVFRRAYTVNEGDLNDLGYPNDPLNLQIGRGVPNMDYNIVFWKQQDLGQLWSSNFLRDDRTGLKVFDRTSGSDAYTATEQNNSGYVAVNFLPFDGKLDIYGGLRVEYNRQKVAGAIAPSAVYPGRTNTPVLADLKSTEVLPSLNISYRPNPMWVARAAFGKTVNRPEFRELSPYSELDYLNNQQIVGNSDLVFATVDNYDLRFEWYPNPDGAADLFSIGGFYKNITNPIERMASRPLGFSGPTTISFRNADRANIYGLELDIRKDLNFIPLRFFRDLSIIANGSYIHSEVTNSVDPQDGDNAAFNAFKRQLQGQAPYQFNIGVYYDNAGSGTKAAFIYNEIGSRIYAAAIGFPPGTVDNEGNIPATGFAGSLLETVRRQLDISVTQRIVGSLQAKLGIQNLLNSPVQIAEDVNFTYKYEKAKYVSSQQTAVTPLDRVEGDPLTSNFRPGRVFTLTLTYGF